LDALEIANQSPLFPVMSGPSNRSPNDQDGRAAGEQKIDDSLQTLPRSVHYLLAPDGTPDAVRTEAIRRAEADTPIAV
jgi:hypothetical protein